MPGTPDPIGRVKACTECRQQKVRCDAYRDYSQPCTRCRASSLPCVISKDFQRRPKQSKAQLQHELERLKAQAQGEDANGPAQPHPSHPGIMNLGGGGSSHGKIASNSASSVRHGLLSCAQSDMTGQHSPKRRRISDSSSSPRSSRQYVHRAADGSNSEPCQSLRERLQSADNTPRSQAGAASSDNAYLHGHDTSDLRLGNLLVQAHKINDCYACFFEHYAPHLEGLFDPAVTPSERYQQSPLLLWAMVSVGARGYTQDPHLYARLGDPLIDLAFKSFVRPVQPLPIIQAAIVICHWPLPTDLIYKEPCQAIAGATMQIAMQNGLHMYTREQDFVIKSISSKTSPYYTGDRTEVRLRDDAVVLRTRIWVYCMLVFQNTYIADGLPPTTLVPCFRRREVYGEIVKLLPEMEGYRLKLHHLLIESTNLVTSSCDIEQREPNDILTALIVSYDDRMKDVDMPQEDDLHLFIKLCNRICSFGLIWLVQREPDHYHLLRLYKMALHLIDLADRLDGQVQDFTFHMPQFFIRMLMYAAHVVVRVHKSPLGETLKAQDAEKAVYTAIPILKKRSPQINDIVTINAASLAFLWSSKKAFVRDGKQNGLRVDMRYRLVLNPVFDSFWWWRMESGLVPSNSDDGSRADSGTEEEAPTTAPASQSLPAHHSNMNNGNGGVAYDDFPNLDIIFQDFQEWWDYQEFPSEAFPPSLTGDLVQNGHGLFPSGQTGMQVI